MCTECWFTEFILNVSRASLASLSLTESDGEEFDTLSQWIRAIDKYSQQKKLKVMKIFKFNFHIKKNIFNQNKPQRFFCKVTTHLINKLMEKISVGQKNETNNYGYPPN
jgi:hypothetical protein